MQALAPDPCPGRTMTMRFYTEQHRFYCGVDLHARTMYLCILDDQGQVVYDKNLPARADTFLAAIEPFRDGLVVAVECLFCWYWLADLCAKEKIAFVLGHALYMKARSPPVSRGATPCPAMSARKRHLVQGVPRTAPRQSGGG